MRTNPSTPPSSDHATHDAGLVASLVARPLDLEPAESAAARASVERCADCRALHDDLVALAATLPTTATPARPRDFTLTPADAARARPMGWRRLLRSFGSARDSISRPLAMGLTTMGIIGMLVASVPGAMTMGAASGPAAPVDDAARQTAIAQEAPAAEASIEPFEIDEPALPAGDGGLFEGTGDAGGGAEGEGTIAAPAPEELAVRDDPTGLSVLFVLAGAMTIAGFGLFALRWTARRL